MDYEKTRRSDTSSAALVKGPCIQSPRQLLRWGLLIIPILQMRNYIQRG